MNIHINISMCVNVVHAAVFVRHCFCNLCVNYGVIDEGFLKPLKVTIYLTLRFISIMYSHIQYIFLISI